ncbi:3-carboxymuconate cyclase [Pleurostoma richardsiae]|uniref:3-carboxymuconate cyclase n=1 Tax=Pleurostoma richardsiae TaxID=41990 RepID=A0AA38VRE6_9PEZI|nr:3-carboxymuconate cyclase [Pleurostoma richardsiae]
MFSRLSIFLLALAPILVHVSGRPAACKATPKAAKAVYVMSNAQANCVAAIPIGADGMLSNGTCTVTGGAGSNSIDGTTNQPAAPDALVSQSSLTIAGNNLFVVNAGSNTVSMLSIDSADPTKLTMIGQPVAVPGEFPNTVAASKKNNLVCVGMTGAKAGVACSSFSAQGIAAMDTLRPINLNQTTPPVGPTDTVSQVFFSNDENTLFTTVKGDPTKNNTGFLASFPVQRACGSNSKGARSAGPASVSQMGVMSSPSGTAVLFGSSTIPGSTDLFVTDASFGGTVLAIDPEADTATLKGKATVDGQKATCWVTISPATNTAFVTDVSVNRLVEMSVSNASIQGQIDLSANGDPGLIDLKAAGNFIYALSPGNGTTQPAVTVVDAVGKKQLQHFGLDALGLDKNAQGMAIL